MTTDKAIQSCVVFLIHGTWGRGIFPRLRISSKPFWFEPGSNFRSQLAEKIGRFSADVRYEFIEWSGSNSIREREKAARQLANRINEDPDIGPNTRIVLIGHSHGGNVAAMCLRHLSRIKQEIDVITIATPFLQLVNRGIDRYENSVINITSLVMLFASLYYSNLALILTISLMALDIVGALIIVPLLLILLFAIYRLLKAIIRLATYSPKRVELLTESARHGWRASDRLLVLRAVDDEAALSLAAGSIANRIARAISVVFGFFSTALLVLLTVIVGWLVVDLVSDSSFGRDANFGIDYGPNRWKLDYQDAMYGAAVLVGLLWVFGEYTETPMLVFILSYLGLFIIVFGLAKSVYGRELTVRSFGVDLDTQSCPDTVCQIDVLTLTKIDINSKMLRHALYDHPDVCQAIATWLAPQHSVDRSIAATSG